MNTLLLEPTDTLFFRDGRPMGGSLSGHGAAWPLPSVTSAALHAALHRAGESFKDAHHHRRGRSGVYQDDRDRKFGSLVTAGPFPVNPDGDWFFPRPADAQKQGSTLVTLLPTARSGASSLPYPWLRPVGNLQPPTKDTPEPWISRKDFKHYLNPAEAPAGQFLKDETFTDTEHSIGIGISPETGTQDGERIYSAHSLRLREAWRMGLLAAAWDKDLQSDLVLEMLNGHGRKIIVGGQQRLCTTTVKPHSNGVPLPTAPTITGTRVKWVLLTPAIFPAIETGTSKRGTQRKAHPGGWLPTWICPDTGKVLLQTIDEAERKRRRSLNASGKGYASEPNIAAHLTAALVGKPIPVTGYALPNSADPDRPEGGAKSTHLAVPAGSVYYFEAESPEAAQTLANALNWHGSDTAPTTIKNRRSTLMGEKGFGLGVCGTWQTCHPIPNGVIPHITHSKTSSE